MHPNEKQLSIVGIYKNGPAATGDWSEKQLEGEVTWKLVYDINLNVVVQEKVWSCNIFRALDPNSISHGKAVFISCTALWMTGGWTPESLSDGTNPLKMNINLH